MQEETTVISNEQAGAGFRRLRLAAPGVAAAAAPGRFVHVRVPGLEEGAMRRPISICDADADAGVLVLFFKVVGRGTEALARVRPGDRVDLLGPLGNGFPEPPAPENQELRVESGELREKGGEVLLVGGGYGVAPLLFLAKRLVGRGTAPRRIHLFVGGRTAADVLLQDEFAALGVGRHVATQDGSLGVRGLVTAPLDSWLSSRFPDFVSSQLSTLDSRLSLFACGPAPMLQALDGRAARFGFPAWLSLDRRMACGVGACLGCVQRVRDGAGGERWARVCSDGPVFPAGSIVW